MASSLLKNATIPHSILNVKIQSLRKNICERPKRRWTAISSLNNNGSISPTMWFVVVNTSQTKIWLLTEHSLWLNYHFQSLGRKFCQFQIYFTYLWVMKSRLLHTAGITLLALLMLSIFHVRFFPVAKYFLHPRSGEFPFKSKYFKPFFVVKTSITFLTA